LALAHYLKGEFKKAAALYEKCMEYSTNPDLLIATTDWLYMTYRRMGLEEKATALLQAISPEMEIIENASYLSRLLLYKGEKQADELLDLTNTAPEAQLDIVTQGYGVANWHYYNGRKDQAITILEQLMKTDYWSAFGYIAAEADLERMREN
jgi:tetratricopeptide (TPR) repeat protein